MVGRKAAEKIPITFYLIHDADVELRLNDEKGKTVWTKPLEGRKGFNQYRWDLVVKRVDSPEPYFSRYLEFAQPGKYEIKITGKGIDLTAELIIIRSPAL
jgi:hypothetical protein